MYSRCEGTASTNADLTNIDPVEVPIELMDVKTWVNKLPDPLLPTLFMDTETTSKNVLKTSKTDLTELQPLCNEELMECEPIQEETKNHISPSTEATSVKIRANKNLNEEDDDVSDSSVDMVLESEEEADWPQVEQDESTLEELNSHYEKVYIVWKVKPAKELTMLHITPDQTEMSLSLLTTFVE
ncbi:hypothetical protein FQA39_LY15437 [Lamprigera yunnana]|nr:hypothetical protein FQA39_LY15437 [Lamprigera yunnana]